MDSYVYIEYPKCLYQGDQALVVDNAEEETAAKSLGWQTAAEFHGYSEAKSEVVHDSQGSTDQSV